MRDIKFNLYPINHDLEHEQDSDKVNMRKYIKYTVVDLYEQEY